MIAAGRPGGGPVGSAGRSRALRFVLLVGILSLFADFTYEGSWSVLGPYLGALPLTVVSALYAPLAFLGGFWVALVEASLWGLGMGVQESIIPAAVATMVPTARRASAYGLFTAGYGIFWFLGSVLIGVLCTVAIPAAVAFALVAELAALPLFVMARGRTRRATPTSPSAAGEMA